MGRKFQVAVYVLGGFQVNGQLGTGRVQFNIEWRSYSQL